MLIIGINVIPVSQAELRALEEGDGSAGGSSPCSETSQEASGPRGVLLKKNRWKTIFPSVASPDSNSRSSDLVDNPETGEPKNVVYLLELGESTILLFISLACFVANSKTSETIGEGEIESSEEKTVSKPVVKEEVEMADVKVETPELKVQQWSACNMDRFGFVFMVDTYSFRLDNWQTP